MYNLFLKKYFNLFITVWILFVSQGCTGLWAQQSSTKSSGFTFNEPQRRSVSLKFILSNNLIVIPLKINNSGKMNFVLDTGVRTAIITELQSSDSLDLNYIRKIKVNGLGEGEPLDAYSSHQNTIYLPGITGREQSLYVLLENIFHLSSKMGMPIHGVIGYEVFKNFKVEINYQSEQITFYQHDTFRPRRRHRKGLKVPIEIFGKKPYMHAQIEMPEGEKIWAKMLIDTGGSLAVWLALDSHPDFYLPEKTINSYLGTGLNGKMYGKIGRIGAFEIGDFRLEEPIASFPDSASIQRVVAQDGRNGSIGSDLLRRFTVLFDYQNSEMTLMRGAAYREPFTYNMSGVEIEKPFPALPIYAVTQVRDDSPAALAGLKAGDQVVQINHRYVSDYTLNEIHNLMQKREGARIIFLVLRDGEKIRIRFKLKELI